MADFDFTSTADEAFLDELARAWARLADLVIVPPRLNVDGFTVRSVSNLTPRSAKWHKVR